MNGVSLKILMILCATFQSFPRSILLSKDGRQLIQWPIQEIEKLRTKKVSFRNKKLKGGSFLQVSGITASQVPKYFNSNSLLINAIIYI